MNPATLSIIVATFAPKQRGQAIGIWAGVSALALAIGPLAGGLITQHLNWNWIFFINLPVGALAIVVSQLVIRESRDTSVEQSIDLPGLATSVGILFALSYALVEGNRHGWTSPEILGLFAASAALLAAFVLVEHRQRLPMLDLSLFRIGAFTGANVVAMLVTLSMFGVFFFVSLYVQNILHYSATQAGAIFLPMVLLISVIAPVAGKLSDRVGSRWLMGGGMTLLGVSLLLYERVGVHSNFWTLLPQLLVGGVGMAMTMSPMTSAAMGAVPVEKAGVGSGVLNSFRQVGGSLGIAVMGAIVAASIHHSPGSAADAPDACAAVEAIGKGHVSVRSAKFQLAELWVQALSDASEDPELRRHLRRHMREVHDFVADLIRRGQAQGAIAAERDADSEAWIMLAGGILGMVGRRVGLLDDKELMAIRAARLSWLRA